ncbi:MAG: glycosyltransferase [Desulfotignum sp.]|nr:glycosyltransferase [Desulfotignum sp.]MCF8137754.1 glycosyltransferase [Desulfotignum sp.]
MTQTDPPQISVIIPSFNRAWTLAHAIDSVLAQTVAPKEIIVVDDGSIDHTPEVLAAYGNRLRILNQPNQGVSSARNLGIGHSTGEFVALLDSDDQWKPEKLACQADFFKAHPEAMICQTEEIWIRNGVRVNPRKKHKKPSGLIFEPSLHLCLVSPSAVMIRKTLFERKGMFRQDFPVCEDYDFWLRVSTDTPIHLIDAALTVKFGGHADQLSMRHSQDRFRIEAILNLVRSGSLSDDQKKAAKSVLKEKCRIYGNGCAKRGKKEEARTYLALYRRLAEKDF